VTSSETNLSILFKQLDDVACADRHRLFMACRKLQKPTEKAEIQQQYKELQQAIALSIEKVNQRKQAIPEIHFPENLPISEKRSDIAQLIDENQVVIVAGETGSGKTTQLPKICLELGRGIKGIIGHTQPRRIAARSVANRIAEELKRPLGELVGYQVRFTDLRNDDTAIKLMTDGILLAEIQRDPFLNQYDTLIIDEAHERSLNIDFLLGYLKRLLPKRPDLKLIITSATIDLEKFSEHFNQAPVIQVSGRTYPVEVRYRPLLETGSESQIEAILQAVQEILSIGSEGDILVFLSGEREIRETALKLRRADFPHLSVLPLYARLSVAEQNKIFQSRKGRSIILSTNVAETSLTVPGIRYVIDPGYARISRYSFRTKVQRLPIEAISQASANQRKGRCGRVSEGVCIRLYSEEDFLSRPEFTDPEILRTNLAAVILQMTQLKLGDVRHFDFVDKPDKRLINDGYSLLEELQAISNKADQSAKRKSNKNTVNALTKIGRTLSQLPVDPRLGRMLFAANSLGCLHEVSIIVSAMAIQDPRERPADKQQAADQKHREHWHEHSDFLAFVNLWALFEEQRQSISRNQLQKWCQKKYLAFNRMREWREIHMQLVLAFKKFSWKSNQEPASYESVHSALLTGLLGNIGQYSKEKIRDYLATRNRRFHVFPGSSQFKKTSQWILAGQLLETSKLYAHTVASIQADWILKIAQHVVTKQFSEPHYDVASGQVMAFEKTSLYGLVLQDKKKASYGKINSQESREIFIRTALVEGQYGANRRIKNSLKNKSPNDHFYCWQQSLIHELHDLEAKSRRRDIIVDDEVIFQFYDQHIPKDIVNLDGFEKWRKTVEQKTPKLLFIDRAILMQHNAADITQAQFPNSLEIEGIEMAVKYHFEPTHEDDGVTLQVPVQALHLITEQRLQWLVPGLIEEKIIAMIKALPKQWRKQFAPVPTTVAKLMPAISFPTGSKAVSSKTITSSQNESLVSVLRKQLLRVTTIDVPEAVFSDITIDPYYQFNLHVLDDSGKCIARSRDLSKLKSQYRDKVQSQLQATENDLEKKQLTRWDFGELPKTFHLKKNGLQIRVYPGLLDQGQHVDLKLFDNPQEARAQSLKGMIRLAYLSQPQTIKYLRKQLLKNKEFLLTVVKMGTKDNVIDDIICAAIKQTCFNDQNDNNDIIRDQNEFTKIVDQCRSQWVEVAENISQHLLSSLESVVEIRNQIKKSKNPLALAHALPDIEQQLSSLFYPGCLYQTPSAWIQHFPRYLKAIKQRLEKIASQLQKDRLWTEELSDLQERYQQKVNAEGIFSCALNQNLQTYRWMIEELRVSFFAQTLGTSIPVSLKRLNKQWELC
jgi:ATP-dependent helicase HrpA